MTHWLILKTDIAKEFAVANALSALGHEVWVPSQITVKRKSVSVGPGVSLRRREAIERPLMPSVILSVHTPPPRYLAAVDHLKGIWRDCLDLPVLIPEIQVSQFRERVDAVNSADIMRIKKSWVDKKKSTTRLKLGDPKLAEELKSMLFGQQQQEAA